MPRRRSSPECNITQRVHCGKKSDAHLKSPAASETGAADEAVVNWQA